MLLREFGFGKFFWMLREIWNSKRIYVTNRNATNATLVFTLVVRIKFDTDEVSTITMRKTTTYKQREWTAATEQQPEFGYIDKPKNMGYFWNDLWGLLVLGNDLF